MSFVSTAQGVLALVVVAAMQAVHAQGKPADWKLVGFSKLTAGTVVDVFYSASTVRRNAQGNIEVWTKGLPVQAVANAKLDKAQIDDTAMKLLSGYRPPAARTQKVTEDQLTDMLIAEEVANAGEIQPVIRILFEQNCSLRLVRELSIWVETKNGKGSKDTPGEWAHVSPETNAATLLDVLCPAR